MSSRTIVFYLLLLLSGVGATADHAGDGPDAAATSSVSKLIASLADPDPAVRAGASEKLIHIGLSARGELLKATHADDPELRARAAQTLRHMQWWTDDDPPGVRKLLLQYGKVSDSLRVQIIGRLNAQGATSTLLRLLSQEPSDFTRWIIAFTLYNNRRPSVQAELRAATPAPDDPAALTLAGRAWVEIDRRKAMALFQQAVDADAARPTNDAGLLSLAFNPLTDAALEGQRWNDAARMLRRQSAHMNALQNTLAPARDNRSPTLIELMALHEYIGPLDGFEHDLQTWSISSPPSAFNAVAKLFMRLGATPPAPMGLLSTFTTGDRFVAGQFLSACELPIAAEHELSSYVADCAPADLVMIAHAQVLLARIAAGRDDDAGAAALLQKAIDLQSTHRFDWSASVVGSADDLSAELHWRLAQAAQKRGDVSAADQEVKKLLDYTPANTDTAISIVVWLKETSRQAQATALFERIYNTVHDRAHPAIDPAVQDNDLAWLCARCNERLDEALKLAQSAVHEMPTNSAFLDTLAEASYRNGRQGDAIRYETKAISIDPDSTFMKKQLERFRKPPATATTARLKH